MLFVHVSTTLGAALAAKYVPFWSTMGQGLSGPDYSKKCSWNKMLGKYIWNGFLRNIFIF